RRRIRSTASRTASRRSTCSRIRTPRHWAPGTGSSMDCKCQAGPMSLGTSCRGSGRMSGGSYGCRPLPGTASSARGGSAPCPTSNTAPTRAAARTCAPTSRPISLPRSTLPCRPDSSRALSGCPKPTTTPWASCPTGSADRDSRGTCSHRPTCRCSATACTHPTICFDYTANAYATASFVLSPTLTSRSTAGVQYVKNVFDRNGAYAENLAPGGTTVTAGSTPLADESTDKTVTLGAFVEQEFG